jgi:hypothetical protein
VLQLLILLMLPHGHGLLLAGLLAGLCCAALSVRTQSPPRVCLQINDTMASSSKLTKRTLANAMANEQIDQEPGAKKQALPASKKGKAKKHPEPEPEPESEPEHEPSDSEDGSNFVPDPSGSDEDNEDDGDDAASVESELNEAESYPVRTKAPVAPVDLTGTPTTLNADQMMHKIMGQMGRMQDILDSSPAFNPKANAKTSSYMSMHVEPTDGFLLTPSKKSLGKMRSRAHKAATKIVFQRIALLSPNVLISDVAGAIALAINLSVPSYVVGSVSGAFVHQMKKALTALLRECKSDLVGAIIDTFIMMHHDTVPPRVSKIHEEMHAARMAIHLAEFAKFLDAPGGYLLVNYPHMHAFHAIITDVGVYSQRIHEPTVTRGSTACLSALFSRYRPSRHHCLTWVRHLPMPRALAARGLWLRALPRICEAVRPSHP